MALVIRLESERIGEDTVAVRVLLRYADETEVRHAGTLYMTVGQYQVFGAVVHLGADDTHGVAVAERVPCKNLNDPRWTRDA